MGVYSTSAGGERMNPDEMTIAQTFKAAGYATAAFGKWHNGMQYPYHPNARGFDEFYGFCSGHWGDYFSPPLEHNGRIVTGEGFMTDDFTNKAMAFMADMTDTPFFLYLAFNTPHSPMQVPDSWFNAHKDQQLTLRHHKPDLEQVEHTRAALAMCENIDWNVGRLLHQLEVLDLDDNTVVVYFSDNGPNGWRWNGGMKGRKGSTDEGGVRSPMLMRWPEQIKPGKRIRQITAAIDLLPTLADLAGIEVASQKPLDGISLKPLILGEPGQWSDRMIFSHWNKRVSIRTQQYRYDFQGHLYDMDSDPGQLRDGADQHPDLVARFLQQEKQWRAHVLSGFNQDNRAFGIGHPDARTTQIPARDGKAQGNIKRSNRFPNCSFFTNWTSLNDRIVWDAEVLTSGTYLVEIYYTCPQADVGATVELSFNQSTLQGRITPAHDPPLRGQEHDRVDRMESYVKDFRPLTLGQINLKKGRGDLTLRALHIPGSQVMDFRLMMLTRID
jgi:arylsulfatase A-like enzyme